MVVYNVGSNAAFVQLGGASVTATLSGDVIQPNSWMAFTVGANGYLAALTSSGATTLNLSGGSGLPTGAGGGGGGGSGGSIPTGSSGSPNSAVVTVQGIAGGTPAPVSVSSLPSLSTGANTIGAISNTAFAISGALPAFASTPTVNAAESGAWNIGNITGTVALPTGAATAANQTNVQSAVGAPATTAVTVQGSSSGAAIPVSQSGSWSVAQVGYDSGIISATAAPSSGAHSAGEVVGGLFTIPIARVNGGSGIITTVKLQASWGSTQTYILRLWQKNPTSTTCTDGSNFAESFTDDANLVGQSPVSMQFLAPANTTGDATTSVTLASLSWDYKNSDSTASQNLYACLVTNGSDTPGSSPVLRVSLSGPQN